MSPVNLSENWDYTLFTKHPWLFLPFLEDEKRIAGQEAAQLRKLFEKHKVGGRSKILDFSCGIGRHTINLYKMGYEVVGYDPSALYLEKAKEWADELFDDQRGIRFYQGQPSDASEVLRSSGETGFDAIIIMGNSFGFSTEDKDVQMLMSLADISAKNCIVIIETENRDWRIRNFQHFIDHQFENLEVHETWDFNLETSVSHGRSKFYERRCEGKELYLLLDLKMKLRLYSLHELKQIIDRAGWIYIESYGDIRKLETVSYNSEHIISISKKVGLH